LKVAKILVHITHGTEHPTRAALGFHVAKAAIEEGHSVTLFLAGDGVQLLRDGAIDHLKGLGTGNLRELYDAVVSSGVKIYLSRMSSKSRGLREEELEGKPYEFGYPRDLVRLSLEHDRLFTY
jgi:predicted peroxiredoxin